MARGRESKRGNLRSSGRRGSHTREGTSASRRRSSGSGSTPLSQRLRRARTQAKQTGRRTRKSEQSAAAQQQSPLRRQAARRATSTPTAARTGRGALRGGTRGALRTRSRAARRGGVGSTGGTRTANLQLQAEQLRSRFARLQAAAELGDIHQSLGRIDARLAELPRELDALRSRGYVHAGLLDEEITSLRQQWAKARPRAETALRQQARSLDRQLNGAARAVNRLSPRDAAAISAASAAVNGLQSQVNSARNSVRGLYGGVEDQINFVEQTLERFDWVLEQFDRSPNVRLLTTEAPLLAATATWHRDGDDGPSGLLFLTDQRLLFEQNEEVATEKLFGLFTTESDRVQRLLLLIPVHQVEQVNHGEEGGFLGIGKQEILELILSARAPVSRARFHIQEQDAADWAVWLKRVQTGEIDRDRAAEYVEEVEAATTRAAMFPSKCPSCFAPLPTPPRGAQTIVCDYCGTVVKPLEDVKP